MKYLSIVFLLSFFSYIVTAQSKVKGVLQKDFETFEKGTNYATAAKKWHLADLPIFNQDDCSRSGVVDLCFLIDATSSMDDQIGFLKAEIKNTIETVQDFNTIRFRTSAVFYRDSEEEYKVKSVPFTNELDKTIQFINNQNSAGGGDYPEAFADGFSAAMDLDWHENADAKLLFIFCDAPPHDDPESVSLLEKSLKTAAAKGITLFPIIGTAADFDTEVIMKSLAGQSEGALISLQREGASTNSHGDFLVDLIQDLMITYTGLADCNPSPTAPEKGFVYEHISTSLFPNPANSMVTLAATEKFNTVKVLSADGKLVFQQNNIHQNKLEIQVGDWVAGMYFVYYFFEGRTELGKLVVNPNTSQNIKVNY